MSDHGSQESNWIWDESLDAVQAAPKSHIILYEDGDLRLVKVIIEPGQKEPVHTHRWHSIMIVQSSARIRYYAADGLATEIPKRLPSSDKLNFEYLPPEGPHAVENIDTILYQALRVEIKSI